MRPRTPVPEGFAVAELPGRLWFAFPVDVPADVSPIYTERRRAVNWCLMRRARQDAGVSAIAPPKLLPRVSRDS